MTQDRVLIDCVDSLLQQPDAGNWHVHADTRWCHVRPAESQLRTQGWKLHVSATPLSAPWVLLRAARVLIRHQCAFKFAPTIDRIEQLVSPRCNRGSGGKFLTAYPDNEDGLLRVAGELHEATQGLPGPGILSDRPYRPGSLVHYRFGAFLGVRVLGNDGKYEAMLQAPDGSLAVDQRLAWFSPPRWAPPDPFIVDTVSQDGPVQSDIPGPRLLDGRYLVQSAVRHAYKGGVFHATDQHSGEAVIIKQARPHVGSMLSGNDVRDALRHEWEMLRLFAPSGLTPLPRRLFEQRGELFLVQQRLPGITLRSWAEQNITFSDTWGVGTQRATRLARSLLDLVELCHGQGLVLRDFNPNNVLVGPDDSLRLIDLELLAVPGRQVVNLATLGYAAPEQLTGERTGPAPAQSADLFGLGATVFHLVSGVDPVLAPDIPQGRKYRDRLRPWLDLIAQHNPAAHRLAPLIAALMDDVPARRPSLNQLRAFLEDGNPQHVEPPETPPAPPPIREAISSRLLSDGLHYLITSMDPADDQMLWPTDKASDGFDPLNVQQGAAGVLVVLIRALRHQPSPLLRQAVASVADWVHAQLFREPRVLPGLYFGRAGTAWALLEAGLVLRDERLTGAATELALRLPTRWPNSDICHGTAGAGLTQLRLWEATGDEVFLRRAADAAATVMSTAHHVEGTVTWPIPEDFASQLAGAEHYGYAHGTAGVGMFLLAAGRVLGDPDCLQLAGTAARTLVAAAQVHNGAAYWPGDPHIHRPLTHWCNGSSGVGTFLLRMWQETGNPSLLHFAEQAATAVHHSRWRVRSTAQCHGLSGDAEFLLDLCDATGQQQYRAWAEDLLACMQARHALRDGRMILIGAANHAIPVGYGTGLAGVVAFLQRLLDHGPRMWLPNALIQPPAELAQHERVDCGNPPDPSRRETRS
ncbi:class IV lanthionine synthetase LanL [Streptomyces sp. R11]|uniref:Class IV lanthionine synthetase LanL n=1 Tax=Streptomyces sp. R11 TaxID=3238625 RepID=A0AB39NCJ5_9ACTN